MATPRIWLWACTQLGWFLHEGSRCDALLGDIELPDEDELAETVDFAEVCAIDVMPQAAAEQVEE